MESKVRTIKIISCTDRMMWYADRVGAEVVYLGEENNYYWSRDDGGYKNIVYKKDARLLVDRTSDPDILIDNRITHLSEQIDQLTARLVRLEAISVPSIQYPHMGPVVNPWQPVFVPQTGPSVLGLDPNPPWNITCTSTGQ